MQGFLPAVFAAGKGEGKEPVGPTDEPVPLPPDLPAMWDGASYLDVHKMALPLARCIAARDAALALADPSARAYMDAQATRWGRQGMDGLVLDGYLADHWVGSFVVAVLGR